ncbi:hypothetical protein ACT3UJ_17010 [Halomonas sp. 86]|uniref:hypothetical protein n=1 Tax=unclassified Halomonas TaxID=2609666 RepID=UPI004033EF46
MKSIDLLALLAGEAGLNLPEGASVVDSERFVDIKKEAVEAVLVVKGSVTVVSLDGSEKKSENIHGGNICYFDAKDKYVFLREEGAFLALDSKIKKTTASEPTRFGFFNRKKKEAVEPLEQLEAPEGESIELADAVDEVEKKSILSDMIPKIQNAWYQTAGPLTSAVVNDEGRFKALAGSVYKVLPMPFRFVVGEEFFVQWCYEKRNILLVEVPANAVDQEIQTNNDI